MAAQRLPALDARERNYARVDASDAVAPAQGRVWAYVGTSAGRRRLRRGRAEGRAVVSRDYPERTRAAFAARGPAALADLDESAALDGLAVWDLERVGGQRMPKPSPLVIRPMSLESPT